MKLLLVFAALFSFVIFHVIKISRRMLRQHLLLKNVPGPPKDNFFLGNISDALVSLEDILDHTTDRVKTYGRIIRIWFLIYPFVFIGEANYAQIFFTSKHLDDKSEVYNFFHVWLGQGLLTISGGKKYQEHRKLVTPAFHFSILNTFADTLSDNSAALITRLRQLPDGNLVDIFTMFSEVALDNICGTAMGVKNHVSKISKLEYIRATNRATHTLMTRVFKPWYWDNTSFNLLPIGRRLKQDLKTILQFNDEIINERRRQLAVERRDISMMDEENSAGINGKRACLDILLDASESESHPFDVEDLKGNIATLMLGGYDTTASAMSLVLYLLGHHPNIQEKCYDELDGIFNGSDRKPTTGDLMRMKYLEQVIKEGLRLYPSAPILSRRVPQDIEIGDNYVLPAGTEIVLVVSSLHRDPKYFPDPEKFDPDRFSPENSVGRHPFAYVPFAAGSRNCIGQKFAMLEEKVVLSYILRNFTVESEGDLNDLKITFSMVARSSKTLNVKFKPRNGVQR